MTPFQSFMCGAGGAALITSVMTVIRWAIERRAAKKDKNSMNIDQRIEKIESDVKELREGDMRALIAGVRSLLYSEIKDRAKTALAAGEVTAEELEDISRKHELYHGPLSGNGYLDTLMDKLRALPVREQRGD
ncbi:MAG: hypothetical protein IKX58_07200 [Clostridia bacterium]|nr:hypothetical protein [Clostridia bacterium]